MHSASESNVMYSDAASYNIKLVQTLKQTLPVYPRQDAGCQKRCILESVVKRFDLHSLLTK